MRLFALSTFWTVTADCLGWLLIHLGVSWLALRWPATRFDPESPLYRPRAFEEGGTFYEWAFKVRRWKKFVPDAAPWFQGGFMKERLAARDGAYLDLFLRETCRAELAHWLTWLCGPVFFLWNFRWAGVVMLLYGGAANLPCLVIQRYNRARLLSLRAASAPAGQRRRKSVMAVR